MDKNYSFTLETKVINGLGMHARPAAKIAEMATSARAGIWLSNGVQVVDATSIIDILTLCAVTGTRILIHGDQIDDRAVAQKIQAFFDQGFGEEING